MKANHFFAKYYSNAIFTEFAASHPEQIKPDYRREIGFVELLDMVKRFDPATTTIAEAININRGVMAAQLEYLNSEKIKDPNKETGRGGKSGKFIRTGNWIAVKRNHYPKSGDGFTWLLITENGYYSNIRNHGAIKHLGWDMSLLPFDASVDPKCALFEFFKTWDGKSPFLAIELVTGPIDLGKLSLSYDARHVSICSDVNRVVDVSNLLKLAKESEVNHA